MYWKEMLGAIAKPDKNATRYELSTDYKYEGLQEYPRPQLQRKSYINLNGSGTTASSAAKEQWYPTG